MLGHLHDAGFGFTPEAAEADVIVVNTCGFIEDAKRESIDAILEMARAKEEGRAKKLIVTGCLVQRYSKELAAEVPEIDVLLGNGAYLEVAKAAQDIRGERVQVAPPKFIHDATTPRVNTFLPHSAYVKVAEGCDQKCTFCIIPALRGTQRSRPIADIVREAEALAERGVVEINLVAQDLTGYGHDLRPKVSLAALLRALGKVEALSWIRLHYAYPRPFPRALLAAIAEEPKVVPYIDMPLQHIADPVLKRMRRGRPRRFIEELLSRIRAAVPGVVLRTSFIVGFPGETERDFAELLDFLRAAQLDRVGCFAYSPVDGAAANRLPDPVAEALAQERLAEFMRVQEAISAEKLKAKIGRTLEVLVDRVENGQAVTRSYADAPEIDGVVRFQARAGTRIGELVAVRITGADAHDLTGFAPGPL